MPMLQSQGARLHVEDTGSGYPIIFVHEFGSDLREWEPQIRYFAREYRCITYNARGYPPSDVPESPDLYGWEFSADDVIAVMDGLSLARAHIVGLSMGGYAVLQCGLRHPDRVSAIVAAGAGTGSHPIDRAAWLKEAPQTARRFTEQGMAAMAAEMANSPTRIQLKYKDPRGWQDFHDHLRDHSEVGMSNTMSRYQSLRPSLHDFQNEFRNMAIPTLLAVGDEDAPCIETNVMLKSVIPQAGLWVCANTGHAINLEEPGAFNQHVGQFLSQVERGVWRRPYASD